MNFRDVNSQKMVRVEYFVRRICSKEWVAAPQIINFANLVYVVQGSGTYIVNSQTHHVSAGSLIYIPFGSFRQAFTNPQDPMLLYAADFHYVSIDQVEENLNLPIHSHIKDNANQLRHMFGRMHSLVAVGGGNYGLAVSAVFSEILAFLSADAGMPGHAYHDGRIRQMVDFVMENIDRHLTPTQVAEHVHLNASYLNTIVHAATGKTLTNYMNYLRVNVAENILRYENVSVQNAAERCGFVDPAYFSRVFKTLKGYSPVSVKRSRV